VDLENLNDRWRIAGHPHAVPGDPAWKAYCPACGYLASVRVPLHAAMSDALTHKNVDCPMLTRPRWPDDGVV